MTKSYKVLFISPGASISGAPLLFINMLTWLKENSSIIPFILTSGSGPLEGKYLELASTYKWDGQLELSELNRFYLFRLFKRIIKKIFPIKEKTYQEKLLNILKRQKFDLIYANSVASCEIVNEIKKQLLCKLICHIRELEISIFQFCGKELFHSLIPSVDLFIADAECVRKNLISNHGINEGKVKTVYEYIILSEATNLIKQQNKSRNLELKKSIGIPEEAFTIASCGTTDWRKGADLVVHIAKKVYSKTTFPIYFIWIGGDNKELEFQKLYYDLVKLSLQDKVKFLGIKEKPLEYYEIADLFMLCSREEPVGIVALEAASLGKPILCFDQAGGMSEFVEDDCGFIIPYLDFDSMADHIIQLQNDKHLLSTLGENASRKVKRHDINIACKEIETIVLSVIES
jgi:glycosyltransferase involved in cell wall biosynthesis